MELCQEADAAAQTAGGRRKSAQVPAVKRLPVENVSKDKKSLIHQPENASPPHFTSQRMDLIQANLPDHEAESMS